MSSNQNDLLQYDSVERHKDKGQVVNQGQNNPSRLLYRALLLFYQLKKKKKRKKTVIEEEFQLKKENDCSFDMMFLLQ